MEFVRVKKMSDPSFLEKKSKFKEELSVRITAFYYCQQDQIVTAGLSTGKIIQFRRKGFEQKNLMATREYEVVKFSEAKNGHKGEILVLLYQEINSVTYIFTGSADRTIKLWENDPKTTSCIQTLAGHGGTILALQYGADTLFSASNDKTMKVWKQENGREFLYHPWFVVVQVIYDFSMKKQINYQSYITAFLTKSHPFTLFAGDTEGSLHLLRFEETKKKILKIDKSYFSFHRLHVIQILELEKDGTIFSIGYDQKIQGFGESGGKFFTYKNPHKCLFTSISWSQVNQELIASDEQGRIYFMNISSDKQVLEFKLYDEKILGIQLIEAYESLMVFTDSYVDILRIKRGIRTGNLLDQHKGPIVGLALAEFPGVKQIEPDKLISASLDNTLRIWDPKDMSCISVLENSEKSEISSIHYLQNANLLATGHDNGEIRLWNIDIGSNILLIQKHSNVITAMTSRIFKADQNKAFQQGEIQEFLFSTGYDGKIYVWEIFERKSKAMAAQIMPQLKQQIPVSKKSPYDTLGNEILCILFDDNTNCIVAAGNKAQIYFIEMFTYEHKVVFTGHKDSINCLAMDGRILFSGSDDKTIRLWDTLSCQFLTSFEAHDQGVTSLIILSTGHLVSAGQGAILVWDYPNQKTINKFIKPERMKSIVYLAKEKSIFVGTEENNIYNYVIEEQGPIQKLELNDHSEYYSMVKQSKKTFVVTEEGLNEEHDQIESPHKQTVKRKTMILHDVKPQDFSNEYLQQLEEQNKQILSEFMK